MEHMKPIYKKVVVGFVRTTDGRSTSYKRSKHLLKKFLLDNSDISEVVFVGKWSDKNYLTYESKKLLSLAKIKFGYSRGYTYGGDLWYNLKILWDEIREDNHGRTKRTN